jgi:hypothetical protein
MIKDYKAAHKHSINHKEKLMKDKICGCFYCEAIFEPKLISEWVADTSGTALCPFCGIASILPEYSGYPITPKFLRRMNRKFFGQGTLYGPGKNGEYEFQGKFYEKTIKSCCCCCIVKYRI